MSDPVDGRGRPGPAGELAILSVYPARSRRSDRPAPAPDPVRARSFAEKRAAVIRVFRIDEGTMPGRIADLRRTLFLATDEDAIQFLWELARVATAACPVHPGVLEPCPECSAMIAAGL